VGLIVPDATFIDPLRGHNAVGLDSNVFIYLLETSGNQAAHAGRALDAINTALIRVAVSAVAIAEVLTGPARAADRALMERYLDEIRSLERLTIVPVDDEVAFAAAMLRGRDRVAMSDAINLAATRISGGTAFITNDQRLRSTTGLEIIPLVAFAA
jgi:predicted nucleic acid-binding protein